jgi:biotin transport system substrate-specific component
VRADAATLRLAVFPRSGILADVVLVVAGAALVALAAQIEFHLPFTPVPITGQTFAVLLVGASLGAVRGVASLTLYLAVGLVGAPVYAGGEGGWEWFTGATGGYLVGFVVAAALTGWLAEQQWDRRFASAVAALLSGNIVVYLFGLPWLARVLDTGFERTLELGLYPFVVGAVLKLYLAGALLPGAWRLVERATGRPPSRARPATRRNALRNR